MRAPSAGGSLRAVLDTNVVVSGLINPSGPPAEVLENWLDGAFEAVACGALLSEVATVTLRPHLADRIRPGDRDEILDFLVNRSRFVPDNPHTSTVAADPDDDYLVALARTW
ncbi:MAG: putative toxin-antitoxin system toxin component, PIN family, partial [Acidobacteria bacterium]|nr:putative toxin-antitoxin system toxin component, PIN family [Acidobacteriota bacterium]